MTERAGFVPRALDRLCDIAGVQAVADGVGRHRVTVYKWRKGVTVPDANDLAKLYGLAHEYRGAKLLEFLRKPQYNGARNSKKRARH